MNLVSKEPLKNNPPGKTKYGLNCYCECHFQKDTKHIMDCCLPKEKDSKKLNDIL